MILETPNTAMLYNPKIHQTDTRLRSQFGDFESTFIILNPFTSQGNLISWANVLNLIGDNWSLAKLNRAISFYHAIVFEIEKDVWNEFYEFLKHKQIEPPLPETIHKTLTMRIFNELLKLGYDSLKQISWGEDNLIKIRNFSQDKYCIYADTSLETLDKHINLSQFFDQVVTFLSGERKILNSIIENVELEGFFADDNFNLLWDYVELDEYNLVKRDEIEIDFS